MIKPKKRDSISLGKRERWMQQRREQEADKVDGDGTGKKMERGKPQQQFAERAGEAPSRECGMNQLSIA